VPTILATVLAATLLAVEPAPGRAPSTADSGEESGEVAEEPAGGVGVSPVELIPRLELRHVYQKLEGGVSVHDTILESDIEFLRRLLLRYQLPARTVESMGAQVSGIGDIQLGLVGILGSTPRFVAALLVGAELDTATQPQLGAGKQQLQLGAGAALKPWRWWLAYAVVQEQFSVSGDPSRPDVNQLMTDFGSILFGRQFNWLKFDLATTVDFTGATGGRLYGTGEAGSLVIGRVGLFVRAGTQLAGPRLVDYSVAAGVRYLFRLQTAKPRAVSDQSW
jgi:hypothetical protein